MVTYFKIKKIYIYTNYYCYSNNNNNLLSLVILYFINCLDLGSISFDDMGSSSLLRTENEITIKLVSFVIFAPSPDIFILTVKLGSSISILFG